MNKNGILPRSSTHLIGTLTPFYSHFLSINILARQDIHVCVTQLKVMSSKIKMFDESRQFLGISRFLDRCLMGSQPCKKWCDVFLLYTRREEVTKAIHPLYHGATSPCSVKFCDGFPKKNGPGGVCRFFCYTIYIFVSSLCFSISHFCKAKQVDLTRWCCFLVVLKNILLFELQSTKQPGNHLEV